MKEFSQEISGLARFRPARKRPPGSPPPAAVRTGAGPARPRAPAGGLPAGPGTRGARARALGYYQEYA
jgi:hypothetical protein